MDYLLKASAVLLIFYVCYQLFLQRETFFQANRWFLLSGLVLASCLPFVIIPIYIEYTPVDTSGIIFTVNDTTAIPETIQEQPFDYNQLFSKIYLAGLLFFFGKLILEFLSLKRIFTNSKIISTGPLKIMETDKPIAPFSFFNRIVYNPNHFKKEELSHVVNHENVHIKDLHSVDTSIAQLCCLVFWFNPIVWLYKKALQQNLEFIADQKAQYISDCEKSYQTVLLKASVKNHQLAFTNNFYTSLIKKRIVMLHKSKSNNLNQLKFALILPVLALFMMSFNTKEVYVEVPSEDTMASEITRAPQTGDIEIVITKDTTDEQLKELQDQLKNKGITFTYSGVKRNNKGEITSIKTDFKNENHTSNYNIKGDDGIKAFKFKSSNGSFGVGTIEKEKNSFIYETKDGKKVKTQSSGSNKTFVFVSDEDEDYEDEDHSTKIKVKSSQNIDTLYFEKAKGTAQWISKDGSKTNIVGSENGNTNVFVTKKTDEPIFIIDGKVVKKSLFEDVDSDEIKSINVLKGKTALENFGDKGKNGVVIMTKKGSKNMFIKTDQENDFNYEFMNAKGEEPLIILNGKVISEGQFRGLEPNNIMSIDVLKDENAIKVYGEKGKNGVIVINSKVGSKSSIFTQDNDKVIIEVEEASPWKIKTGVTTVYEVGDPDDTNSTAEFVISKNSTDAFLDRQKKNLKEFGIDAKFTKVRRNKAGEITSIKIALDDNQGRKSSASWREKDQAIPDIVMGKSKDDKLFVRAIKRIEVIEVKNN